MMEISDNKIYYVGYSNGQSENHTHYICMYSEDESITDNWCKEVNRKFGSNTIKLIMTGKMLKYYNGYGLSK